MSNLIPKFKGWSEQLNQWVYGDLVHFEGDAVTNRNKEIYIGTYRVDKLSVGQYIGFSDKNGTEIYSGDMVELEFRGELRRYYVEYDTPLTASFRLENCSQTQPEFDYFDCFSRQMAMECKVVGNKYVTFWGKGNAVKNSESKEE